MRRILLALMILSSVLLYAEDIIVTRSSQRIAAIIEEVGPDYVKYHKKSDPKGPIFRLEAYEIATIIYGNGDVQTFDAPAPAAPAAAQAPAPAPYMGAPAVRISYSDTVEVLIMTNVPANIKINGFDCGEISSRPYLMRYGQYEIELTAEGYAKKTMIIDALRGVANIYNISLTRQPYKSYPFRKGLCHEVSVNYTWLGRADHDHEGPFNSGLIDYVIGWRFNRWVFAGLGTGINICEQEYDYDKHIAAEMPIYAHAKVYFMDSRWTPYLMTSIGGRFVLNKTKDMGMYFNAGPGVEYRLSERYALNLAFAFQIKGTPWEIWEYLDGSFEANNGQKHRCGFTIRAGFAF